MARTKEEDNFYRKEILKAVEQFWKAHGYAPSTRDIAKKVGSIRLGRTSSTSVIDYHLGIMEEEGTILREKGVARTIRPTNMEITFVPWEQIWYCELCDEHHMSGWCPIRAERDEQRERDWYQDEDHPEEYDSRLARVDRDA